ncbi:MAG: ABC transporter ATP-binding protein [Chitinophagales bacterium]
MIVQATQIAKRYGALQVLNEVSLDVKPGEVVSVVGASGAGKSTFLQILGTLDKADSGKVVIDGQDVASLPEKQLAHFRNKKLGFIFQFHHLLPEFTGLENVCIPAMILGVNKTAAEKRAMELLEILKLTSRANHKPSALSGGEQQRFAVARALINAPAVVLADEPSGNLDSDNATALHQLFFDLRKQFNQTFIIVTHNTDLANMADRKITMKDGRIHNA